MNKVGSSNPNAIPGSFDAWLEKGNAPTGEGFDALFEEAKDRGSDPRRSLIQSDDTPSPTITIRSQDSSKREEARSSNDSSRSEAARGTESTKQAEAKRIDTTLDAFSPLAFIAPDLTNLQDALPLIRRLIEAVGRSESVGATHRSSFKVKQAILPIEISLQETDGVYRIRIMAGGELKDLILHHIGDLMDHLRKKDINVASLDVHDFSDSGSQQSDSNNSGSDDDSNSQEDLG